MNADGSNRTRLTNNWYNDWHPSWSSDGTKIAFSSARDGTREIYVMDADGSNQTRLTDNSADDLEPSWSPDGAKIAFETVREGNFERHLQAERNMAGLCFAFDRPNYARYVSYQHVYLSRLKDENREAYDDLVQKGFGASTTSHAFLSIHGDFSY